MSDDLGKQVAHLWDRFRKKASETVERQSASLVRGKNAARDVFDDAGNLIVGAGRTIDDAVIEKALGANKMPALVAAVAAAQTQDLTEMLKGEYDRTPDGQDRRHMADSDEYIEARCYIYWRAAVEVTDIRGNVLVPAGKPITDEDVRNVREAGQLAALIYSAQQSGPPPPDEQYGPRPVEEHAQPRRHATPLGGS